MLECTSDRKRIIWEHCYWHPDLRCVYVWVPKAASTSVKRWLVGSTQRWGPVHSKVHDQLNAASLSKLPRAKAHQILLAPEVFKFAFVRNPYTRLVSAFVSIMVSGKVSVERLVRHHALRTVGGAMHWARTRFGEGIQAVCRNGLSFRELVDQLERENPATIDPHFRSQSELLTGVPLDFIGRMENLTDDFRYVRDRLCATGELQTAYRKEYEVQLDGEYVADWPVSRFRELKAFPHWRRFYPPDLAQRVSKLLAQDFHRFGYSIDENLARRAA